MLCYGNYVDIKKLSNCHSTLMVTSAMEITFTLHTHGDVRMRLLWKLLPHCRPMVTSPWSCNENYIKFSLFYKKNAIHISCDWCAPTVQNMLVLLHTRIIFRIYVQTNTITVHIHINIHATTSGTKQRLPSHLPCQITDDEVGIGLVTMQVVSSLDGGLRGHFPFIIHGHR